MKKSFLVFILLIPQLSIAQLYFDLFRVTHIRSGESFPAFSFDNTAIGPSVYNQTPIRNLLFKHSEVSLSLEYLDKTRLNNVLFAFNPIGERRVLKDFVITTSLGSFKNNGEFSFDDFLNTPYVTNRYGYEDKIFQFSNAISINLFHKLFIGISFNYESFNLSHKIRTHSLWAYDFDIENWVSAPRQVEYNSYIGLSSHWNQAFSVAYRPFNNFVCGFSYIPSDNNSGSILFSEYFNVFEEDWSRAQDISVSLRYNLPQKYKFYSSISIKNKINFLVDYEYSDISALGYTLGTARNGFRVQKEYNYPIYNNPNLHKLSYGATVKVLPGIIISGGLMNIIKLDEDYKDFFDLKSFHTMIRLTRELLYLDFIYERTTYKNKYPIYQEHELTPLNEIADFENINLLISRFSVTLGYRW